MKIKKEADTLTIEISPEKFFKSITSSKRKKRKNKRKSKQNKKRIYILDEIRGTAVIAMVIYHFLFSSGYVFKNSTAYDIFKSIRPVEPIIAVTFIFVAGICTKLSRSNLKRGCILFAIALAVNIITEIFMPNIAIRFGVINLLSVCMILYGLLEKFIKKIKPLWGLISSLLIFILTWGLNHRYIGLFGYELFELPDLLYQTDFLYPLGFRNASFSSGDYFPLFPWIFMFMSGSNFAQMYDGKTLPKKYYKQHSSMLSKAGQYSLLIYILHQPIIFAVLYVVEYLQKLCQ